jgi:hypothetical protein
METKKLALLLAFAFVISGIVTYQVRATRNKTVARPQGSPPVPAPAESAAQTTPAALPQVSLQKNEIEGTASQSGSELPGLSIPTNGWGRSPFLTVEELRKLNEPAPAPVTTTAAPPPVVDALPQYVLQGTQFSSRQNAFAIINDKTVHVGDKIGREVVKEIKKGSVILELDGKTREIFGKASPVAEPPQSKGEK